MPTFRSIEEELQAMLEISEQDLTPEQKAELETYTKELEEQAEDKIDAFCGFIKATSARIDAIKAEANRLAGKARVMQNNIDRMKRHYLFTLDQIGKAKANGKVYSISKRRSVQCVVFDESIVPTKYVSYTPKISLSDIKADIKNGVQVPGAELRDNYSLAIK